MLMLTRLPDQPPTPNIHVNNQSFPVENLFSCPRSMLFANSVFLFVALKVSNTINSPYQLDLYVAGTFSPAPAKLQ